MTVEVSMIQATACLYMAARSLYTDCKRELGAWGAELDKRAQGGEHYNRRLAVIFSFQRRRSAEDELTMREYLQEGDLISVTSHSYMFSRSKIHDVYLSHTHTGYAVK